jgi:glycosyltransferase involved in cell wall biosynthesis
MPTVSVVLPTRDRPAFVRQALGSLVAQAFTDFEVVVADNPVRDPCKAAVDELGDERVRYIRPERPLSMHDNWESGCAATTGDYVGVVIDKTVWLPSTLSHALALLEESSASVISWWSSSFAPHDVRASLTKGRYYAYPDPPRGPAEFDGAGEIAGATAFDVRRGGEGPAYFRGKICFGLYRRDVLDGIRDRVGRLFPPVAPDYTSRAAALATAPSFLDAGVPLQLSYLTEVSSGRRFELDASWAKTFLDEIDPGVIDRLPLTGVYASHHNVVAHDYLVAERLGTCKLNRLNLARRAREDLAIVEQWPDSRERRRQYRLLADAERRAGRSSLGVWRSRAAVRLGPAVAAGRAAPHGVRELQYRTLLRMPRVHGALRRLLRRPPAPAPRPAPPVTAGTLESAIRAAESQLPDLITAEPH